MRDLTSTPGGEHPQVSLQREGISRPCGCLRFEPHGAIFDSPCKMDLMSDLLLSLEWRKAGSRRRTVRIEGIVVDCRDTGDGCFEITLLFLPGGETCSLPAFTHSPN